MERAGGIIMPIFSLNGDGIGTFGKEAYDFVDFLKRAHQKYWQVLPIGPTSCGNSPYSSMSTFAGNPNLINTDEFEKVSSSDNGHIDYDKIIDRKTKILKKAFEDNFDKVKDEVLLFAEDNSSWIYDYTLYMALKEYFDYKPWYDWPQDIRLKSEDAVKK